MKEATTALFNASPIQNGPPEMLLQTMTISFGRAHESSPSPRTFLPREDTVRFFKRGFYMKFLLCKVKTIISISYFTLNLNLKVYRVVQLNFTPEIEVFYMLVDRSLSNFSMTYVILQFPCVKSSRTPPCIIPPSKSRTQVTAP